MEMSSLQWQEQIAYSLSAAELPGTPNRSLNCQWAWVEHRKTIYFTRVPRDYQGPVTAVTKLIQFLFDEKVDHSFFILRNRIYSTESINPLSAGMVALAAKRATGEIQPQDHGSALANGLAEFQFIEMGTANQHLIQSKHLEIPDWSSPREIQNSQQAKIALKELMEKIPRGPVLHDYNREIAVVLCDFSGKVLSWALNSNSKNKTLHAEVLMIQNFYRKFQEALPEDSKIYVSLKPCRMCAAMISFLAPPSTQVFYFENDPGPQAKNTELEKRGMLTEASN